MRREDDPRYQQQIDAGYLPEQILSCAKVVAIDAQGWHMCRCQVVDAQRAEPMPPASECGLGA